MSDGISTTPALGDESLHARLRRHTASLHQRLDAAPPLRALLRPGLDQYTYAAILQRFASAYAELEPPLLALEKQRPASLAAYRQRLPALQVELSHLPRVPTPAVPVTLLLPHEADMEAAHYLGMRYVLDGSTQGARVIAGRLAQHLTTPVAGQFAFWQRQREAAEEWPSLLAHLADLPVSGREADAMLAAATAVFTVFIAAFAAEKSAS